jgi:FK506-binding protein 1
MGVKKSISKPGDSKNYPKNGDRVTVHYIGELTDGTKFDSSVDRNKPFVFNIGMGQVIKGWDVGVSSMSIGEVAIFRLTPDYGYGARGSPPTIPPNAELVFQVQLLAIN